MFEKNIFSRNILKSSSDGWLLEFSNFKSSVQSLHAKHLCIIRFTEIIQQLSEYSADFLDTIFIDIP